MFNLNPPPCLLYKAMVGLLNLVFPHYKLKYLYFLISKIKKIKVMTGG